MPDLSRSASDPAQASAADAPEVRLRDVINMIIGVMIAVAPWSMVMMPIHTEQYACDSLQRAYAGCRCDHRASARRQG